MRHPKEIAKPFELPVFRLRIFFSFYVFEDWPLCALGLMVITLRCNNKLLDPVVDLAF